jgi:hypothetical protein
MPGGPVRSSGVREPVHARMRASVSITDGTARKPSRLHASAMVAAVRSAAMEGTATARCATWTNLPPSSSRNRNGARPCSSVADAKTCGGGVTVVPSGHPRSRAKPCRYDCCSVRRAAGWQLSRNRNRAPRSSACNAADSAGPATAAAPPPGAAPSARATTVGRATDRKWAWAARKWAHWTSRPSPVLSVDPCSNATVCSRSMCATSPSTCGRNAGGSTRRSSRVRMMP